MTDRPIPASITFEQAIDVTQTLLAQLEQGRLSDIDLEQTIAQLVATENGARGFFVTYLSDDRSIADQPSAAVVRALQSSPAIVSELLVKNLAMSSAMAVSHHRNHNETMAQGSDRVRTRTAHLIEQVQIPAVFEKAEQLRESAATGIGAYEKFLERWAYDAEQRQVIYQALGQVMQA